MQIRKASVDDLAAVMELYAHARHFMARTGNPTQWADSYPPEELIRQDMAKGICYVCVADEKEEPAAKEDGAAGMAERADETQEKTQASQKIEAVFMYTVMDDPTYRVIEQGEWPNDRAYGVLHRIASRGRVRGTASFCMQWCFEQCGNLRCDTHEDNKVMQHVLEKNGFVRCGRIYVEDGSPRIAFQKVR